MVEDKPIMLAEYLVPLLAKIDPPGSAVCLRQLTICCQLLTNFKVV